jgi:hypothetical protein
MNWRRSKLLTSFKPKADEAFRLFTEEFYASDPSPH